MNSSTIAAITAIGLSNLPVELRSLAINLLQDHNTSCSSDQLKQLVLQVSYGFKFLSLECRRCLLQRILEVACGLNSSGSTTSIDQADDVTQLIEAFFAVLDLKIDDQDCRARILQAIWKELFTKVPENRRLLPSVIMQLPSHVPTIIPAAVPHNSWSSPARKPETCSMVNFEARATPSELTPESHSTMTQAEAKPASVVRKERLVAKKSGEGSRNNK